jgi:hypothetical protein
MSNLSLLKQRSQRRAPQSLQRNRKNRINSPVDIKTRLYLAIVFILRKIILLESLEERELVDLETDVPRFIAGMEESWRRRVARKIEVGPGGGCLRNSGWVWLDAVEVERSRDVGDV